MYQTRFEAEIKDNLIETVIFFFVVVFFLPDRHILHCRSLQKKNGVIMAQKINFFSVSRARFLNNFCYNITKVKRTLLLRSTAKASSRSKNYASLSKGVFLWREEMEVFRSILHALLPCLRRLLLN